MMASPHPPLRSNSRFQCNLLSFLWRLNSGSDQLETASYPPMARWWAGCGWPPITCRFAHRMGSDLNGMDMSQRMLTNEYVNERFQRNGETNVKLTNANNRETMVCDGIWNYSPKWMLISWYAHVHADPSAGKGITWPVGNCRMLICWCWLAIILVDIHRYVIYRYGWCSLYTIVVINLSNTDIPRGMQTVWYNYYKQIALGSSAHQPWSTDDQLIRVDSAGSLRADPANDSLCKNQPASYRP